MKKEDTSKGKKSLSSRTRIIDEKLKFHLNPKGKANRNAQNSVNRIAAIALFTLIQIIWIGVVIMYLNYEATILQYVTTALSFIVVLTIYGRHTNSANKMPWMIFIMVMPVFGNLLYLLMGRPGVTSKARKRYEEIDRRVFPFLHQKKAVMDSLTSKNPYIASRMKYVLDYGHFPVYQNTDVIYFDDPVLGIRDQIAEMEKARSFIFMEYYAIQDAETFEPIRDVLARKAAEGLEVRIIYDDIGSGGFINTDFIRRMEKLGIGCRVFNHVSPFFQVIMNNRDHRKITVIDGVTAYTGGYNLANLYTHVIEPHGFWKDTGVRLRGDAVPTFTALFLEMWNAVKANDIDDNDLSIFFPRVSYRAGETGSYIQPYADTPLDEELTGENIYMGILQTARRYCYFVTPYLVITDELSREFEMAVKRGVDVRIITPGIPDKKAIYAITRSYYNQLARNGVRIYEYDPGFCHAKMCVADDEVATVGTVNLDFRSLYLHFEDGVLMYNCRAVRDIKADFDMMLEASTEVTDKYHSHRSVPLRIEQCALRVIAPLV
jgi:cardiolipin synthase